MENRILQEKNQTWYIKKYNSYSNNIKKYYKELFKFIKKRDLKIITLGKTSNEKILLINSKRINKKNKNILIAGSFHGDEPAGSWGILEYIIKSKKTIFNKINISFVPIVNPIGFKNGNSRNLENRNPNRHFTDKSLIKLSTEGKILKRNIKLIKYLAKDGFLTLHEDYGQKKFYIYSFEKTRGPGLFSKCMLESGGKVFGKAKSGIIDGCLIKEGIIFKEYDGSFEDYLFRLGVPITICSETPRKKSIDLRIKASEEIIKEFIKLNLN